MRHLFIVNPVAGKLKPEEKERHISRVIESMAPELREGSEFEIYVTRAPMDACAKIKAEAQLRDELRVYACGGDGTLNECVNGAAGLPNVAVTHFPCGTGNDFIKTFGLEKNRFFDLEQLVAGEVRPLDIIDCNGRYSINICSVGLDARIGIDVHKYSNIPIIGGATGYVVSTAANYIKGIKNEMTVEADGLTCGPELNMVCICNGRFYGGGFNPTKDARPDDGIMDCLIISGVNRLTLVAAIMAYSKGKYKTLPKYITCIRTKDLHVFSPEPQVINVDGEEQHAKDIHFHLVPGGVNFVFPKNMEFFTAP
ncbi:MAG: YegS/Rv2252/BmrU family lipid kinase [Oscillospiraceae bacterium]